MIFRTRERYVCFQFVFLKTRQPKTIFSNLEQEPGFVSESEAVSRSFTISGTTNDILTQCYDACDLEHLLSALTKGDSGKIHHKLDGLEPLSISLRFRWFLSPVDSPAIDSEYQWANLL